MTITIREAAEAFSKGTRPTGWRRLLLRVRKVFGYREERDNRVVRFAKIVKGYAEGRMVNDLEREYGCSKNTILRYARLSGQPRRDKGYGSNTRKGVIEAYLVGEPIATIASRFDVSQAYVSKTATEEGINRRRFKPRD